MRYLFNPDKAKMELTSRDFVECLCGIFNAAFDHIDLNKNQWIESSELLVLSQSFSKRSEAIMKEMLAKAVNQQAGPAAIVHTVVQPPGRGRVTRQEYVRFVLEACFSDIASGGMGKAVAKVEWSWLLPEPELEPEPEP